MLDTISKQINTDLQKEKDHQDFLDLIHEDVDVNNFIDDKLLNLSENGVKNQMLKNEMPFLFIEDTVVDDELITNLQQEIEYEDDFEKKPISDNDTTTDLQEPKDYTDDFDAQYASDADADTKLAKEVDYADNQTTPVDIEEFSNEAAELLFEMGDILGALTILEEAEADMTVPNQVECPDEGETIPQADEADVCDTEYPNMPEGVVMEEEEMDDEDLGSLEEDFFSLFESADEDDEEESEDEDEDDEEESDEDDEEESEDEDDEDKKEKDDEEAEELAESFSILDMFGL